MRRRKGRGRILSDHELAMFSMQMAMLLKSGISPYEGVNILFEDTQSGEGKKLLLRMKEVLSRGERLHTALEASQVFPDYYCHMVEVGEEAGSLDTVLDELTRYYTRQDDFRETISEALSYPLLMIFLMFVVIVVLITRVLPIFGEVFASLGTEMNAFSASLMHFGSRSGRFFLFCILGLGAANLFLLFLVKTQSGHHFLLRHAEKFIPTRNLAMQIATGRFAEGMALMLSSGMDTFRALEMVNTLVENQKMQEKIAGCKRYLQEGDNFPDALKKTEVFSLLYTRLLLAGFQSGSMDAALSQIALQYDKETGRKIYHWISFLEPTLIILLSLIVGMILLSVLLPLMGIMSAIG